MLGALLLSKIYMNKPCLSIIHLYCYDYLTYFSIQINFSVREIFYLYDPFFVHAQPLWCHYASTLINMYSHCIWKMSNLHMWSFLEIYSFAISDVFISKQASEKKKANIFWVPNSWAIFIIHLLQNILSLLFSGHSLHVLALTETCLSPEDNSSPEKFIPHTGSCFIYLSFYFFSALLGYHWNTINYI